jgi:hypothetical protein
LRGPDESMSAGVVSSSISAEPSVVYHAICGIERQALTGFMHRAFVVVHDEAPELGNLPSNPDQIHPIDPASLSAIKLFTFRGHGLPRQVRLRGVYPEFFSDSRYVLFTFLADPLRLAGHAYGWYMNQQDGKVKMSFPDFLRRREPNLYAKALECGRWNYRSRLTHYFFLGVAERSAESVAALAGKLDDHFGHQPQTPNIARARYFIRRYFDSPEPEAGEHEEWIEKLLGNLDGGTASDFRKRNGFDYRLYEHARRSMAEDLEKYSPNGRPEFVSA